MKTLKHIALILFNLIIPCLLPILLVIVCFFVYGSGASGSDKLEEEIYIWTGAYVIVGLLHLFLVYKFLRFISKKQKILFTAVLSLLYFYFAFNYMK